MNYGREIQLNREYWEAVLGSPVCGKIIKNDIHEDAGGPDLFKGEFSVLEPLCGELFGEEKGWEEYPSERLFGKFFRFFGRLAVTYAGKLDMIGGNDLKKTILSNFYASSAWIPMRVLIKDIHSKKEKGMLQGADPRKEYEYYQDHFLGNRSYIRELCRQYPEMKRLLFLKIITVTEQIKRIMSGVSEDAGVLNEQFFPENPFKRVKKIKCGLSDAHNGGQTVAEVFLDNQKILIYKPRDLAKDQHFMKLYESFCRGAGLSFQNIHILARKDYSWESYIERRPCGDEPEVRRYFQRTGILLFLCRLLNAGDMHGENIIAGGEYPVPVDLETLPGNAGGTAYENADRMTEGELKRSVLSTGILPVITWGGDGKGIILNALNRGERVKTPFRVPAVREAESSGIHIAYQESEAELKGSLPVYQGKQADPSAYAEEICCGFECAYRYFQREKEQIMETCRTLFSGAGRHLIRHTQQYQMYLQASFYPELLEDGGRRRLFLHVLDKGQRDESLAEQERNALFQMDIPAFYQEASYDGWKEDLKRYGEEDLKRQLALISLSLGILEHRIFVRRKSGVSAVSYGEKDGKERLEKQIRRAADQACDAAFITDKGDIGFYGPQAGEDGNYRIGPSGPYLYEGTGGTAVFLAEAVKRHPSERYRGVLELCVKKLFRCTAETAEKLKGGMPGHTGAFLGEGSAVHTYLLLYKITGEERFLAQAERHAEPAAGLQEAESSMDYISGLSGAVTVYAGLFRLSGEKRYLETAVQMGERIWKKCGAAGNGAGWRLLEGVMPLAGLAHGNSGLILAFGSLLELTGDMRYAGRIKELLKYEDSLYENGNWKDLRHPEGLRVCNNAWCHGAAGILLSRLKLKQCGVPDFSEWVEQDIERCRKIFLEEEEPAELCLCHGLSGNYMALGQYLRQEADSELEKEHKDLRERILRRLELGELPPRERYNPALMTGISGIGYALCGGSFDLS